MASWTTPPTFTLGEVFSSTDANTLSSDLTFLYQAPYASYYNGTATSIASGAFHQVTNMVLNAAGYGWSLVSNNLHVPLTGVYQVNFRVSYASGSSDGAYSAVYQNGGIVASGSTVTFGSGIPGSQSVGSCILTCSAGDNIGLYAYQTTGSNVSTATGADNTALEMFFIGSQ